MYAALSALWILLSDRAVEVLFSDPALLTRVQIAKGWCFVAVTAVLLWLLVQRALARQRRAVADRESAQARERMAFEASRDALFVYPIAADGAAGCFEMVNDEACRRLGRSRDDLLRLRPLDINAPEKGDFFRDCLGRLRRDGQVEGESEHMAADGSRIPVEVASRLVVIDGQELVVSSARDLRQRKAEQARLVDAERMAAVGLLAGGLAHEFNNLHAVAVGHLEFIERDGADPETRRHAAAARTALERAAALTGSLLDFARPHPGARKPERLDLVAAETLALVRGQLLADGITIEDQACVAMPPLEMDRNQIGQVVMNLLINARHAMSGRSERRLRLATVRVDGRQILSIGDTGGGIPEAVRDRIFLPFFTSKGLGHGAGTPRGIGLGLSISKAMAEAHGGGLEVESAAGVGSLFKLWLPEVN